MPSPLPEGLQICHTYAAYARALVAEHTGKGPKVKSNPDIPLQVRGEIATLVGRVLESWRNKGEFHFRSYQVHIDKHMEQFS
jgi:hypothetical protein